MQVNHKLAHVDKYEVQVDKCSTGFSGWTIVLSNVSQQYHRPAYFSQTLYFVRCSHPIHSLHQKLMVYIHFPTGIQILPQNSIQPTTHRTMGLSDQSEFFQMDMTPWPNWRLLSDSHWAVCWYKNDQKCAAGWELGKIRVFFMVFLMVFVNCNSMMKFKRFRHSTASNILFLLISWKIRCIPDILWWFHSPKTPLKWTVLEKQDVTLQMVVSNEFFFSILIIKEVIQKLTIFFQFCWLSSPPPETEDITTNSGGTNFPISSFSSAFPKILLKPHISHRFNRNIIVSLEAHGPKFTTQKSWKLRKEVQKFAELLVFRGVFEDQQFPSFPNRIHGALIWFAILIYHKQRNSCG